MLSENYDTKATNPPRLGLVTQRYFSRQPRSSRTYSYSNGGPVPEMGQKLSLILFDSSPSICFAWFTAVTFGRSVLLAWETTEVALGHKTQARRLSISFKQKMGPCW